MVTTTLAAMDRSIQQQARDGLQEIVEGLTADSETALARVWLLQTEYACDVCRQQSGNFSDKELGLHLAASAGRSRASSHPQTWNRLDGMSHRFPLRSQKIGHIGATGEPLIVRQTSGDSSLTNPQWLEKEGIQSFFGYPIADGQRIFGVLGVFLRRELTDPDVNYLRQIANLSARLILDAERQTELRTRVRTLSAENSGLRRRSDFDEIWGPTIGVGPASRKWEEQIRLAAQHDSPVLIRGERGSGKEYTARRIHSLSNSAPGPFLIVDAKSLDVDFLEQQLVGSNRDASSSAVFDEPAIGTLMIKSIEQAPTDVQKWLSDFLIHREDDKHPHGKSTFRYRILTDSIADLDHEVATGRLLNQLYCALSISEIRVPSLRTRPEDVPSLAKNIIERLCKREQRTTLEIPARLLNEWKQADWPGNARELELVVMRCFWRASQDDVEIREIETFAVAELDTPSEILRAQDLKRNEKANLLACLKQCDWKVYGKGGAAEMLGMKPTTLIYRMKILGIRRPSR